MEGAGMAAGAGAMEPVRRVLVTGATGLLGSWLTQTMVEGGHYVVCLIRNHDPGSELYRSGTIHKVSVVSGRLEDFDALCGAVLKHEVDTVFHLGAQAIVGIAAQNPRLTFEANIRGTWNLLEACRLHGRKLRAVVVASSDKAYGEPSSLPYVETKPPVGKHPYDVSKACADLLAQSYAHDFGLPEVVARCGNIYGGGDLNWSRLIPGTIKSLLQGDRPVIRSDGTFLRDYVYVKDAVAAYVRMAEACEDPKVHGEAFNFGPGAPTSALDVVGLVRRLMDCLDLEPIVLNEARGEIPHQYLDASKAERILGLKASVSLPEGLQETIAWYRRWSTEPR